MSFEDYSYPSSPFPFLDSRMEPAAPTNAGDDRGQHVVDSSTFVDSVPFQMPHFIYSSAPTLASGGGAEVLPVGMLNNAHWMINNGFVPRQDTLSFFSPKLAINTHVDASYDHQPQPRSSTPAPFDFDNFPAPIPISAQAQATPSVLSPGALSLFLRTPGNLTDSPSPPGASQIQQQPQVPQAQDFPILSNLPPPSIPSASTLGLPLYSASGFDLLSVLSRVATRPYPRIQLGPVDLTCSFVVVDTRRHDHPIVYCSPSFCKLTGYPEHEILGRNCRFLQSSTGRLEPGAARADGISQAAAAYFKKHLGADKECQTAITNYRKDGSAFTNLVSVIPIYGGVAGGAHEENDVVFHVGFQVDLTEQPGLILEKVRNGSYILDYASQQPFLPFNSQPQRGGAYSSLHQGGSGAVTARERKTVNLPPVVMSKEMRKMLADPAFVRSIPLTTSINAPVPTTSAESVDTTFGCNHLLHLMLLEVSPDFIHVVSLKGSFLYVAPSVRRVLGFEPEELVGGSIADLAHPEDVVPLMRELKESSATGVTATTTTSTTSTTISTSEHGTAAPLPHANQGQVAPRTVDLLFRARTKNGHYVWVECRGRLHVEPGKGRKAIVLCGRAKEMPSLTWDLVARGGGLAKTVKAQRSVVAGAGAGDAATASATQEVVDVQQEFWGSISNSMVLLAVGSGVRDVLGWSPEELQGRNLAMLLPADNSNGALMLQHNVAMLRRRRYVGGPASTADDDGAYDGSGGGGSGGGDAAQALRRARCSMRRKDGGLADVYVNLYRPAGSAGVRAATSVPGGISPAAIIYQIRLVAADTYPLVPTAAAGQGPGPPPPPPSNSSNSSGSHFANNISDLSPAAAAGPTPPLDLSANIFKELEITRGTSWQYELQQLKYANQRLLDEIATLEAAVKAAAAVAKSENSGGLQVDLDAQHRERASCSTSPFVQQHVQQHQNQNQQYPQQVQQYQQPPNSNEYHHLHNHNHQALSSPSILQYHHNHNHNHNHLPHHHHHHPHPHPHPHHPHHHPALPSRTPAAASASSLSRADNSGLHPRPAMPMRSMPVPVVSRPLASRPTTVGAAAEWAGLGPSPFVQRLQREVVGASSSSSSAAAAMKRPWGAMDGSR